MLTDAAIRKIGLRDKPYKVSDMHGLYLLVNPNGARYWRWNFSHRGKRQTLSLGVYPEVSLKEARENFEREYLRIQINRFSGNISRTAAFIGMERSALHRKLKLLGLTENQDGEG